jgi:ethanolamine utilization protein EutJ
MSTMTGTGVDALLRAAAARFDAPAEDWAGDLRCGVDLGTATIVLTVVDAGGTPVYLDQVRAEVVRDGVVVDFAGATAAVRRLRVKAQERLGRQLVSAATAYPPGVGESESRACRYVLEQAGFECRTLVDEVSAAQALLALSDGAIADVGGGSTGVGVYRRGELVALGDLPGGGHHLNLILAGALDVSTVEAEELKRNDSAGTHAATLKPGIERIAANIGRLLDPLPDGPVHLVGGALMVPGAGRVVSQYLGHDVVEHDHALLMTPLGIALS